MVMKKVPAALLRVKVMALLCIAKVRAVREAVMLWLRPSKVLGLLLCIELILAGCVLYWAYRGALFGVALPQLADTAWVGLAGGAVALAGWIVTALVNIRNSIKQHTVNVLLQSRLSTVYMGYAERINSYFFEADGTIIPLVEQDFTTEEGRKKVEAARYILNYMEFLAVGIRHGDFHEGLLKRSLRTIVINIHSFAELFITRHRKGNPRVYANFMWLYGRWQK